jgi:hypothetical protein
MQKIAFLLLAPLLCGVLTACAAHTDPSGAGLPTVAAPPAVAGQGGDTLARIHALVGVPSCSADAQCKTLALGARPCGGPEGYLAYSSARTPEAELRVLGGTYQAERRAANNRAGMVSDCRVQPDPGAVCRAGACTLGAAPSAPVAR